MQNKVWIYSEAARCSESNFNPLLCGINTKGTIMKYNTYIVWFSNCNYEPEGVTVKAINQNEALILAQAERVKDELDYTLNKIDAL